MFSLTNSTLIAGGIYSILLAIAAVSDFRTRRIPNQVCLALAIGGIAFSLSTLGIARGSGFALGGLAGGFAIWIPFYALGWLGAGDVKLIAAAGAWLGSIGVIRASLAGAIVGGGVSLAMLLWQRNPKTVATDVVLLLNTVRRNPRALRLRVDGATGIALMPYGVAL